MVRDRIRSFNDMLIREYAEKDVWVISHHLTKLSFRASIERWSPEEFIRVDNEEKPVNCGVTIYGGNPKAGKDGKLELKHYNLKLYWSNKYRGIPMPRFNICKLEAIFFIHFYIIFL